MKNTMDKKEQLVATAFNLFYKYGIHAVGINRVLEESGIAKKTLYNHFSSKEDLIAATVEYCDQQYFSWLDLRLHEATPGRDALYAMLDAFDDLFQGLDQSKPLFLGCYFINVSAEFSNPDHDIHKLCARNKEAMLRWITHHTSLAITSRESIVQISETIAMLLEGAIIQAHVLGDLHAARKAKAVVKLLLDKSN
ncbi:TPA: TetR/AcrR family transcriptional regulator [Pseudomonas aeruginosa]|jgi:AcrR family transcriptional regulator|uniref:TetR/AcrR family transcriptional regulator n=2 Tax=Pseudomonadota TaxID=1224 RepID=A0A7H0GIT2_9BURK|nr:TetR/AcrR family transcriptional regulator [Alcaligenes faecalis]MBG5754411.1 TetR/AcrR family transcriptional regulator [Pseudomonas aeruginosa]QNP48198.1 TetR/AcrR family transcriptional regulator [Diaphorobacter aerolatus]MBH9109115.1 TetR/AcrR family transcriptional regulator [Pseudomonas aeruginosa]MBH9458785.1 TetR/AcrR family transcriptional regulator [Pseudomonas aeruginosa]|tara:strand:- start:144 stop:728 length:585 start_codon:yes stop_codon:yes gene_type:complete